MSRAAHRLPPLDDGLSMAILAVIVLVTVAGVFMRYVAGMPFTWLEELQQALMVWFTFLGASVLMQEDKHISMNFLVVRFPARVQYAFGLFRMIIMTAVLVFLFVWGILLLFIARQKITPSLGIPYTFIDVAVPVSAAAMLVHLFRGFANRNAVDRDSGEDTR